MDLHNMIPYVASKCKTRRARCHGGQAGRGRQRESGRIKISHIWGRRAAASRSSQKVGSDGAPPCGRLQPYRRAERDFLRKRRSKGAGGWLVFLSQTKTSRSKADFAPTRRRGWDSPRRPRTACLPDCAAPGHRSPGRGDAALRPPLFRPSNPFLLNSKAGRPCVARAPCFGVTYPN